MQIPRRALTSTFLPNLNVADRTSYLSPPSVMYVYGSPPSFTLTPCESKEEISEFKTSPDLKTALADQSDHFISSDIKLDGLENLALIQEDPSLDARRSVAADIFSCQRHPPARRS